MFFPDHEKTSWRTLLLPNRKNELYMEYLDFRFGMSPYKQHPPHHHKWESELLMENSATIYGEDTLNPGLGASHMPIVVSE